MKEGENSSSSSSEGEDEEGEGNQNAASNGAAATKGPGSGHRKKTKRKNARRNIKDVLTQDQLEATTKAAQVRSSNRENVPTVVLIFTSSGRGTRAPSKAGGAEAAAAAGCLPRPDPGAAAHVPQGGADEVREEVPGAADDL